MACAIIFFFYKVVFGTFLFNFFISILLIILFISIYIFYTIIHAYELLFDVKKALHIQLYVNMTHIAYTHSLPCHLFEITNQTEAWTLHFSPRILSNLCTIINSYSLAKMES